MKFHEPEKIVRNDEIKNLNRKTRQIFINF